MIKLVISTGRTKQRRWKCLNCINKVLTQTYKKEDK